VGTVRARFVWSRPEQAPVMEQYHLGFLLEVSWVIISENDLYLFGIEITCNKITCGIVSL
jgi:hypothetical protein